ncbi:uncharacterized protein LOC116617505 [Nematostella vectensis]|uniref:uncharacterized protein LOC116617505 n=1 Tax=Nematostella vectensis TaxID=45351 RepID=UPI002076DA38|nr:uncharacterized protein LOC116617505 [Nematostella vectensis]
MRIRSVLLKQAFLFFWCDIALAGASHFNAPSETLQNITMKGNTIINPTSPSVPTKSSTALYTGMAVGGSVLLIVFMAVIWGLYVKQKRRRAQIQPRNNSSDNSYPYYLEQRGWQQFRQPLSSGITERTEKSSGSV